MQHIVDEYEQWLRSWGAAERTIKARREMAKSRLAEWGLPGMTPQNIQTFLARPTIKSDWSRATYYSNLTDFCGWLVASGHLDANPMDSELVKSPRRPKSKPRPLTERDVARILEVARGNVRAFIILALFAGLRAHEIAKISGEDVTDDGIFVDGKGGKKEVLPCHPEIAAIAVTMPSGYWFTRADGVTPLRVATVSAEVGKLFTSLGIAGSVHRCRHTYATRLLRAGVNIREVQKLMRHESLETTAAYTAVDEDRLSAAINLLPSTAPAA